MSAAVTSTLTCDHAPCSAAFTGDGWPNQARDDARRSGWSSATQRRVDDSGGNTTVDRCPAHPFGIAAPLLTLFDL